MLSRCCFFLLAVLLFAGCKQETKVPLIGAPPPPIETNFDQLQTVLAVIPKMGEVLLYEGLPSDFWEPELVEQELKSKKTTKLHGYPLYEELLAIQGSDGEQFTTLLSGRNSYAKLDRSKSCGGFYPDYCLEWKAGDGTTHVLICLECGEVKIHGPKQSLHCDLSREAAQNLKKMLSRYRKNRPDPKPNP